MVTREVHDGEAEPRSERLYQRTQAAVGAGLTAVSEIPGQQEQVRLFLTIRGTTKPVTVNFQLNGSAVDPWGNFRVGFEGQTTINRKDWGVSFNAAMEAGGVLVSEKVNLEFEVEAVKVKPAA